MLEQMFGVVLDVCQSLRLFFIGCINVSSLTCHPSKDHWQVPWLLVTICWPEIRRSFSAHSAPCPSPRTRSPKRPDGD